MGLETSSLYYFLFLTIWGFTTGFCLFNTLFPSTFSIILSTCFESVPPFLLRWKIVNISFPWYLRWKISTFSVSRKQIAWKIKNIGNIISFDYLKWFGNGPSGVFLIYHAEEWRISNISRLSFGMSFKWSKLELVTLLLSVFRLKFVTYLTLVSYHIRIGKTYLLVNAETWLASLLAIYSSINIE